MLTLQLAACIGMIMGCFILFEISLEDFTADLFGGILGKPRNIQDAIMEETNTRKIPYIKRELLEVHDILLTTGREKQFPLLCTTSFCTRGFSCRHDGEFFHGAGTCCWVFIYPHLVYQTDGAHL